MTETLPDLDSTASRARAVIAGTDSLADLEQFRVEFLGKKGAITAHRKALGALSPDERKSAGARVNAVHDELVALAESRRAELERVALERKLTATRIDVTQPGRGQRYGALHPLTRSRRRIEQLFRSAGFTVDSGPEIEDDWHNFEALNIPANHPARAMHDTFYFPDGRLLRTHTSPVQIRAMMRDKPPLRMIIPGRVYRCDSDMTHTPMFHHVEGLVIDEGVSLANLKSVLHEFAEQFFEQIEMIRLGAEMADRATALTLHAIDRQPHLIAAVSMIAVALDQRGANAFPLQQVLEDLANRSGAGAGRAGHGDDGMSAGHGSRTW